MLGRIRVVGIAGAAALGCVAPAPGQDQAPASEPEVAPLEPEEESDAWRWTVDLYGRHSFTADLDAAGDLSTSRLGAIVEAGGQLDNGALLSVSLRLEASSYDFSDAGSLGAGADGPIDEGYDISLRPMYIKQINDEWGWLASPFLRFSGEKDVSLDDAVQFGGFAGVTRRYSDTFSLTLGVGGQSRFEDDPLVIPFIAFQWNPTETLTVESDGLGVNVTKTIDDAWSVRLFARYEPRDFRLDDDGPIPDGALRDDEVLLGVGLAWAPSQRATLDLTVGATVYRELETLDDDGRTIEREQVDPALFVSARFLWEF